MMFLSATCVFVQLIRSFLSHDSFTNHKNTNSLSSLVPKNFSLLSFQKQNTHQIFIFSLLSPLPSLLHHITLTNLFFLQFFLIFSHIHHCILSSTSHPLSLKRRKNTSILNALIFSHSSPHTYSHTLSSNSSTLSFTSFSLSLKTPKKKKKKKKKQPIVML
ncbi:hypothetical protein Hanom_Chr13g01190531 [Helianthus anomalus]